MIFTETPLRGAFMIDLERREDERGFFARTWCQDEFAQHGLDTRLAQCNISFNVHRGTLRGMHYQIEPFPEAKLVRCTMGGIYDVILDLRTNSTTYKQWFSIELTAANHRALFVPVGFAHGFQALEDNSEVLYQMSEFYHSGHSHGVRWNDVAFKIKWPLAAEVIISDRDAGYPDFRG